MDALVAAVRAIQLQPKVDGAVAAAAAGDSIQPSQSPSPSSLLPLVDAINAQLECQCRAGQPRAAHLQGGGGWMGRSAGRLADRCSLLLPSVYCRRPLSVRSLSAVRWSVGSASFDVSAIVTPADKQLLLRSGDSDDAAAAHSTLTVQPASQPLLLCAARLGFADSQPPPAVSPTPRFVCCTVALRCTPLCAAL